MALDTSMSRASLTYAYGVRDEPGIHSMYTTNEGTELR